MKIFQKGFNYSQDGPGNRLVYHLLGCNMRCPWCSNPEGFSVNGDVLFEMTPQDILAEALSCKPMFFDGGGVTFTGGECTLWGAELTEALKLLQENGIDTCIETNGTSADFEKIAEHLNQAIIDLKHPDSDRLQAVCGVGNEVTRQNIIAFAQSGKELLIRVPLIGGFNTDREAIDGFAKFFCSVNRPNVKIELLKYHEYGKDKWEKAGLQYKMENAFVREEQRCETEENFRRFDLNVVRT
ncbi:MAG: radical SAM protein [Clostridia bacterium]|nr:radical SAM protein [Clostridia bacterium]